MPYAHLHRYLTAVVFACIFCGSNFNTMSAQEAADQPRVDAQQAGQVVTTAEATPSQAAASELDQILHGMELETIYETTFDEPIRMISESELLTDNKFGREIPTDVDWVLEGAAEATVKEGRLFLKNDGDHCVLWNKREFPESFVAEWDFQHHAAQGTAIIFFAAQGNKGGSIFSPGLPKRGGRFGNYTGGAINCYHTSYSATDEKGVPRGSTHLKKDGATVEKNKIGSGLSPIDGKTDKSFRIRLAKLKNRLILEIDGKISFDVTDNNAAYTSGQIGFRQMVHTVMASYGGFKVQRVKLPATP